MFSSPIVPISMVSTSVVPIPAFDCPCLGVHGAQNRGPRSHMRMPRSPSWRPAWGKGHTAQMALLCELQVGGYGSAEVAGASQPGEYAPQHAEHASQADYKVGALVTKCAIRLQHACMHARRAPSRARASIRVSTCMPRSKS